MRGSPSRTELGSLIDLTYRAIKARYQIAGELKWRDFAPRATSGRLDHLDATEKENLRSEVYQLLTSRNAVRIVAVVGTPSVYATNGYFRHTPDGFYRHALKSLSERFQYFLQDVSRDTAQTHTGLLVCDARGGGKDQRLVEAMHDLMMGGEFVADYKNIVEGLFMADSRLSTGVQLADMAAGAIWHKEARGNERWFKVIEPRIRRDPSGNTAGWGIVRI